MRVRHYRVSSSRFSLAMIFRDVPYVSSLSSNEGVVSAFGERGLVAVTVVSPMRHNVADDSPGRSSHRPAIAGVIMSCGGKQPAYVSDRTVGARCRSGLIADRGRVSQRDGLPAHPGP